MTDFPEPEPMDKAIHSALSSKQGRTALEVWSRCPKLKLKAVRDRLKALAEAKDIESELTGDPDHQVREYRSK